MAGACVLALLLVAGVGGWWLLRPDAYVVPDPSASAEAGASAGAGAVEPELAARSLAALVTAVDGRDAAAAGALGDAGSADLLRAVVGNAQALDVADFALRYVDEVGAVSSDGRWEAAVEVAFRFDGWDSRTTRQEVLVGFRAVGDRVAVVGFGGGADRVPLWLTGPVAVRTGTRVLVLAAGGEEEADLLLTRAEAALPVVGKVLPAWRGPLVIEVPTSDAQLDEVLGADAGTYAAVAAVTASTDGATSPGSPLHVYVNPGVYDALDPVGAQVVISHEATHVATEAPLHVLPEWLVEGFADYVALRDVDLPITTTAGQVIAEVRADGPPAALPDAGDFDEASDGFGAAYEAAWLACRVLAESAGEAALVRVYEDVTAGTPIERALRDDAGLGVAALTRAWQQRLRGLAG